MKISNFKFVLTAESGLHIGGIEDSMKIGGIDSPVIKREIMLETRKVKEPYIPGSSLKGKVRSLLELYFEVSPDGSPTSMKTSVPENKKVFRDMIVKLFGESAGQTSGVITRGLFRDGYITSQYRKLAVEKRIELFEAKYENVIDRKTGTTKQGGLRQIERVPSGIKFDIDISLRYFENSNEQKELISMLILGLKLLELDALGGSGSRGYGKVSLVSNNDDKFKFENVKINLNNEATVLKEIENQLSNF